MTRAAGTSAVAEVCAASGYLPISPSEARLGARVADLARCDVTRAGMVQRSATFASHGPAEPLRHYRYRWIRKRGGAARLIESPKPRMKAIQGASALELPDHVPTHPAAHGFSGAASILSCAAHGRPTFCLAWTCELFPSIVAARVLGIFLTLGYSEPVARSLTGLCTTWTPPQVFADYPLAKRSSSGWKWNRSMPSRIYRRGADFAVLGESLRFIGSTPA